MFFVPPIAPLNIYPALVESEGETSGSEQEVLVTKGTPKKVAKAEVSGVEEIDDSNEASHAEDDKREDDDDDDENEDDEEEVFVEPQFAA